jgi:hypothetical protein
MNSDEPNLRRLFGSEGTMGLFVALYLILLAFFILLNAVSEQAASKAAAAMESVNVTFKESRQVDNRPTIDPSAADLASKDVVLRQVSRAFLAEMDLPGRFATKGGNSFEVQFPTDNLFLRGSLRVRPDMRPFLDQLIAAVQAAPNGKPQQLAILFGTGSGPVARVMTRPQEIAVRRAGALARYLRRKGLADGSYTVGFTAIPEGEIKAAFWSAPSKGRGSRS